jgi:hypothetical protein
VSEQLDNNPVPLRSGVKKVPPIVRWGLSQAGTHMLALATICGFFFFVLMHLYYVYVYTPFEVRPEELGITKAQSLTDAFTVMVLIGTCLAGAFAIGACTRAWVGIMVGALGALLLIFLVLTQVNDLRGKIRAGEPVKKNWIINPLAIRAVRGRVVWITTPPDRLEGLSSHRVLYLGAADNVMVIFDPTTDTILRLPISAASFVSHE